MTQAETEVAKDLPRNGPSGTYSQAWMSRADQSLRPTTPKTWSAKSSAAIGCRAARAADHEPELGLDVETGARPEDRAVVALPLAARPDDRRAAGDDGAAAPVVADGQVPPVGQQRLLVGPEDLPDVGGVVERGVEVDVVADLERHPQLDLVERHQVGLDQVALRLVGDQPDQPGADGVPDRPALAQELVERRLPEHGVHVEHLGCCDRGEVEDVVADPGADPGLLAGQHEDAVRQVVGVVRRTARAVDPAAQASLLDEAQADEVVERLATLQEPNEVNQRRAPVRSLVRARATRSLG